MRVLVLNGGSSSLKFKIIDVAGTGLCPEPVPTRTVLSGAVHDIGRAAALQSAANGLGATALDRSVRGHAEADLHQLPEPIRMTGCHRRRHPDFSPYFSTVPIARVAFRAA
jgi:acetate kinase